MKIKQLKELIEDLPDDMELSVHLINEVKNSFPNTDVFEVTNNDIDISVTGNKIAIILLNELK